MLLTRYVSSSLHRCDSFFETEEKLRSEAASTPHTHSVRESAKV